MTKHDRYNWSEKGRARRRRHNAKRVGHGSSYIGTAPTAEIAADLNQQRRDFAAQQKGRV